MSFALSNPITGGAQSGFTTPAYSVSSDIAPDINGKQVAVTAYSGTQAGVLINSLSAPFTVTSERPRVFKTLGKPNPVTGLVGSVPRNVYKVRTRKGVLPLAGQPYATMLVTTIIEVPAGADIADPANIRAALSLHIGALDQTSSGIGDMVVSGLM